MGDGSTLKVMKTSLGNIGGLICYEHHMSLAKYALFCQGEQIHASVWPSHTFIRHIIDAAARQYAFEGQCFVIVAGGIIRPEDVPDDFPLKNLSSFELTGIAAIIDPRGEYLAGPIHNKEGLLYAEIDLDLIIQAKMVIDTVGHYSRPEVLSLNINDQAFSPLDLRKENMISTLKYQLNALRKQIGKLSEKEIFEILDNISLTLETKDKYG
jgi:predicted amidohydrolase